MNLYDPCVWNKVINVKQITICFHVDDCKVSHVLSKVVDETIAWLHEEYKSIFEDGSGKMKVHCCNVHEYLGMTLDFWNKHQVMIAMFKYVNDLISSWDKLHQNNKISNSKKHTSDVPENLFKINEDATKLNDDKRAAFHNMVTKGLYLMK